MNHLASYLPQDRLWALLQNEELTDRTSGTAVFADISGFTALTESLRQFFGPRRGAEALTQHLNAVYTALITQVEQTGGSVIGFAGDAITCWFDDSAGLAPTRAVLCALALQQAIQPFTALVLPNGTTLPLALKVAVASGTARRLVVGDPAICLLDTLAGQTITRTAMAEQLAHKGEVLLDEATVTAVGSALTIQEWRTNPDNNERFAVITALVTAVTPPQPEPLSPFSPTIHLQPWLHRLVYEREQSGQGAFLTEFRPCVVLFVRFVGIVYEADEAETQLNQFVRHIQTVAAQYDGTLLQITMGDKGSYAYIVLGALSLHEDDVRRAVKIALELCAAVPNFPFLAPLQIGITQGTLRVGAYGSPTRRAYSAIGDDVNLAARLMEAATAGEILVSENVYKAIRHEFVSQPRPPLSIKGKTEALLVFTIMSERQQQAIRLQEPTYALPMVGRQAELQTISHKLDLTLQGHPQIIGLVAEAGMGKSRLVAEAIHLAGQKGFTGYGGACQSDGLHTPYLAWQAIWGAFFEIDPTAPQSQQTHVLERKIKAYAPDRLQALPLLGTLLNLETPDNAFTKTLQPKERKSALHVLLEDCLKAASLVEPLLLVMEDMHWMDALSFELLTELTQSLSHTSHFPICFVLAYRPPQLTRLQTPPFETLSFFTKIALNELSAMECEQAIQAKLSQLSLTSEGGVPARLIAKLTERTQGNPFYLEELLNFLHDRGLDPHEPATWAEIELPNSLHTLILSRIDQLTEREKSTLRIASIIGRLFRAKWLVGYYPALGHLSQVQTDLQKLHKLDITLIDVAEPELTYLFKHIITHEVTYQSLPFATRSQLHEQLAQYLETVDAPLETLAYHYGQSHNQTKQREYFEKAGNAAQIAYANEVALDYYGRLMPLLTEISQQIDLHLKRGDIFILTGQWDEAQYAYQAALALAEQTQDEHAQVQCQLAFWRLSDKRDDFAGARRWGEQALANAETVADSALQAQATWNLSRTHYLLGDFVRAEGYAQKALTLARSSGDLKTAVQALNILAVIATNSAHFETARSLLEESLALGRQLGDKLLLIPILDHYGIFLIAQGHYAAAQTYFTEELTLGRQIGDKRQMYPLMHLARIARFRGLLPSARSLYEQALAVAQTLGAKRGIADSLSNLSYSYFEQGDYPTAQQLQHQSAALRQEIGMKRLLMAGVPAALGFFALAVQDLATAETYFAESLHLYQTLGNLVLLADLNIRRAVLATLQGQTAVAQQLATDALQTMRTQAESIDIASALCDTGFIWAHQQAHSQAQASYLECITLLEPTEYRGHDWARAWAGLACALMQQPEAIEHGVQTAAFAQHLLTTMEAQLWPIERQPFEAALASARLVLGEEAFQAAWQAGTQTTAVALRQQFEP